MARKDRLIGILLVLVIATGCATTRGEYGLLKPNIPNDGFLGEYAQRLMDGDESQGQAAHFYNDPHLSDIGPRYKKAMLDPVLFFRAEGGIAEGMSQQDAQTLANYMHATMYKVLKEHFEIVDQPGPNTIRFKFAMSNAESRWVGLDVISTIVPQFRALAELQGLTTGKPSFVGSAVLQYKAVDAETGKVLAAGIDRRVGGKALAKGLDKWDDVIHIVDFWGQLGSFRLCKLKSMPNCRQPKA